MQRAFSATTEATPEALFDVVGDIRTYPHWLDVVSDVAPADQADAWLVTLKARVGPFARSKRLRMVRTVHEPAKGGQPASVRFERQEVDGREHSDWVRDVAWSPNVGLRHDLVASGGEDQKVTIWAKEQDQWSRRFVIEGTRVA